MQKRFRRLALFVGAASLAGAAFIVAACGTDNGNPVPTPAAVDAARDTAPGPDGNVPDNDGGADSGADCASSPTLRTNTSAGGFYCPFYKTDAAVDGAAGLSNCTSGQTCCNPAIADGGTFAGKYPPSFCADGKGGDTVCAAQDTAKGSDYQPGFFSHSWECNDKNNCAAGEICVMFTSTYTTGTDIANVGKDTKAAPACNVYKAFKHGGSRCKVGPASANEVLLCSSSDSNCGAGTTCKPFDGDSRDLGSCRP